MCAKHRFLEGFGEAPKYLKNILEISRDVTLFIIGKCLIENFA